MPNLWAPVALQAMMTCRQGLTAFDDEYYDSLSFAFLDFSSLSFMLSLVCNIITHVEFWESLANDYEDDGFGINLLQFISEPLRHDTRLFPLRTGK